MARVPTRRPITCQSVATLHLAWCKCRATAIHSAAWVSRHTPTAEQGAGRTKEHEHWQDDEVEGDQNVVRVVLPRLAQIQRRRLLRPPGDDSKDAEQHQRGANCRSRAMTSGIANDKIATTHPESLPDETRLDMGDR